MMSKVTIENKDIMDTHDKAMLPKSNLVKHTKNHSKFKFNVDCLKGVKKTVKKS